MGDRIGSSPITRTDQSGFFEMEKSGFFIWLPEAFGGIFMTEHELKFMTDRGGYEAAINILLDMCKGGKAVRVRDRIQVNYYYDTPDRDLHKSGVTLRIRQSGGVLQGQIKRHSKGLTNKSEESYFAVDQLPSVILFEGEKAKLLGSLVTRRTEFAVESGENGKSGEKLIADIDANYYLGREDYELEIEYPEGSEGTARKLACSLGAAFMSGKSGKYSRFLKALKDSKKAVVDCGEIETDSGENVEI